MLLWSPQKCATYNKIDYISLCLQASEADLQSIRNLRKLNALMRFDFEETLVKSLRQKAALETPESENFKRIW